jgi:hypothetical protein
MSSKNAKMLPAVSISASAVSMLPLMPFILPISRWQRGEKFHFQKIIDGMYPNRVLQYRAIMRPDGLELLAGIFYHGFQQPRL